MVGSVALAMMLPLMALFVLELELVVRIAVFVSDALVPGPMEGPCPARRQVVKVPMQAGMLPGNPAVPSPMMSSEVPLDPAVASRLAMVVSVVPDGRDIHRVVVLDTGRHPIRDPKGHVDPDLCSRRSGDPADQERGKQSCSGRESHDRLPFSPPEGARVSGSGDG